MAASAVIGATFPSLVDFYRRTDPDGAISKVVEYLAKLTPLIGDAPVREGNLPDGYKFTLRQTLPTVGKRRFNEGVAPTKSTTNQITEPVTMLNAQSIVDEQEANLNGNGPAFRASEDMAFMSAFSQSGESSTLYDNKGTDPSTFSGFLTRLASTTTALFGKQIVKWGSGGSNTNASMLLVGWGEETVHLMFPKGSKGGIEHKDMGQQLIDPSNNGKRFVGLVSDWTWKLGLVIKDPRFVAAVRNIDMSTISGGTVGSPVNDLIMAAIDAYHRIFQPGLVNLVWYVPRKLSTYLHQQAVNSISKSTLTYEEVAGKPVIKLLGVPVKIADQMTTTEAAIS
ncbi:MAG: hypothetical protein JST54_12545 [Deltaproteobacteria bacterium]|nr:hypothetical protein [Deltaproteobacteria bacterium]